MTVTSAQGRAWPGTESGVRRAPWCLRVEHSSTITIPAGTAELCSPADDSVGYELRASLLPTPRQDTRRILAWRLPSLRDHGCTGRWAGGPLEEEIPGREKMSKFWRWWCDGCITKWVYLMPQNVYLKMVELESFILCIFYFNQSTETVFLPRGVLPRKWYPACVQWCFHQPLQACKHLPLYRSPWPPLSGIQAYTKCIRYSPSSELYSLWIYSPVSVAVPGHTTSWSLYFILKVESSKHLE